MNTALSYLTTLPYIIRKIKNVLTHSTVTRNVTHWFLNLNIPTLLCLCNLDGSFSFLTTDVHIPASKIRMLLTTCGEFSPTISFVCERLIQINPPKESISVTYSEPLMNQRIGTETGGS